MTRIAPFSIVVGLLMMLAVGTAAAQPPPVESPSADGRATSPLEFPGGVLWQVTLRRPLAAQPAVDDRHVYVPLSDRSLVAVSLRTGRPVWTAQRHAIVPPATAAGLVVGIDNDAVWALGSEDGRLRWSVSAPAPVAAAPGISDTLIVLPGTTGALAALSLADGAIRWTASLRAAAAAPPVIDRDRVFVGLVDGSVVCLSADSGHQVWSRDVGGPVRALSVADARVYVGSSDNFLYALDARNGREQWRWRTGGDITEPAVSDGRLVYFASMDNVVRALRRSNGNLEWQYGLGSRPAGAPRIADGRVFVAGIAPDIRAYVPKDGTPAGRYALTERIGHTPYFLPEEDGIPARLIAVTRTGTVIALGGSMEGPAGPPTNVPGLLRSPRLVVPGPDILPLDGTVEVAAAAMDSPPPGVPVPPEPGLEPAVRAAVDNLPPLLPLRGLPGRPAPPRLAGTPLLVLDGAVEPPTGPLDYLPGKPLTPEPPPAYAPDSGGRQAPS